MNRSTLRSLSVVFASAVVALSLSPLAANAQTAPNAGPAAGQVRTLQIAFGDGDDGAYYVDPSSIQPAPTTVTLAPGDVFYGDGDQGPMAEGPAPVTAAAPADLSTAPQAHDMVFSGDDAGGMPVDLSAFKGHSNLTATELAGGTPTVAQNIELAQLPGTE
jgi:hypothetical protein